MGRLEQTQFHKIFVAEVEGHTLVVTPRGDSVGFRDSDVADELNNLLSLIGTPGIVNLVVDSGSSEYFGSTMIGAINQLGTRFREIGGKIALCSRLAADVRHARHHAPGRPVDEVRHAQDRPALHEQDLSRPTSCSPTLNARYAHAAFGLRYLLANMGDLAAADRSGRVRRQHADRSNSRQSLLARNPRILGLGVYIWNVEAATRLVRELKRLRPELIIVLGGPEVSYETDEQEIVRAGRLRDHRGSRPGVRRLVPTDPFRRRRPQRR